MALPPKDEKARAEIAKAKHCKQCGARLLLIDDGKNTCYCVCENGCGKLIRLSDLELEPNDFGRDDTIKVKELRPHSRKGVGGNDG